MSFTGLGVGRRLGVSGCFFSLSLRLPSAATTIAMARTVVNGCSCCYLPLHTFRYPPSIVIIVLIFKLMSIVAIANIVMIICIAVTTLPSASYRPSPLPFARTCHHHRPRGRQLHGLHHLRHHHYRKQAATCCPSPEAFS